ncbi:MAG TPA: class I tRNA ligase family protein, partial [Abditibacteriaceae bacterium]
VEPITEPGWTQDEDVLDTWFSSALWPFAVLGWPDNLEKQFYPTSVLITGRDILNLWVSRMILTSLHFVEDEIPFHDVFVHPTVQDVFGLRMSKSLGTGIDPMELIEIYGADATRFGLLQLATGAQDVRFIDQAEVVLGETEVRRRLRDKKPLNLSWDGKPVDRYPQMQSARNFANKIWNAARFVMSSANTESTTEFASIDPASLDLASRWILSRLDATTETVTQKLDAYEFEGAASALYGFIWGDFCDWFVELSKPKLRAGDAAHIALLTHVLETTMRLLHPFMPFLSEDIWQRLPHAKNSDSLCVATWPAQTGARDEKAEADFALLQEAIRTARNLRAEAKLAPSKKLNMTFISLNENAARVLHSGSAYLTQLANLEAVSIVNGDAPRPGNSLSTALPEVEIFLPLEGLIDVERETARIQKELDEKSKDLARINGKLSNAGFTAKAPPEVIAKEEAKRAELTAALAKLNARLAEMK